MIQKPTTLALIVGTRDFFPAEPVLRARREMIAQLAGLGVEVVIPDETASNMGALETWDDAKKWAAHFRANRDSIDGILILLPVFAPERGIADCIKLSELTVPVLVQAYPDDPDKLDVAQRGDAFCGKISLTNNLYQYGIPFTVTEQHTILPSDPKFQADLAKFLGVCRVVRGFKKARIGAVGARPAIFNTVRFSEKLLQASGITVTTVDHSEMFGAAGRLANDDPKVKARLDGIRGYINTGDAPSEALVRLAKLGVVLDDWIAENEVDATAIQCWTSIQKNYGINACTLMSMYSDSLMPSGCEVDVTGVLAMYALQLASGKPERAGGLEQQLRQRAGQVRAVPLRQLGQELLQAGRTEDELRRNPGDGAGRGEHLRHGLGPGHAQPADLCPHHHRRPPRGDQELRGRGPHHRRPAGHLRQPRRGGDRRPAEAAPLPSARAAGSTTAP